MNIFVLDLNPRKCAEYHNDKHVVKMILETAQILSTVHHLLGGIGPYKKTHAKHPCTQWGLESIKNYNWLCDLGIELCKEYTYRYGKIHKTQEIIEWLQHNKPELPNIPMTEFAQAMPVHLKDKNAVRAYRQYYITEKRHLSNWKNRDIPHWYNNGSVAKKR